MSFISCKKCKKGSGKYTIELVSVCKNCYNEMVEQGLTESEKKEIYVDLENIMSRILDISNNVRDYDPIHELKALQRIRYNTIGDYQPKRNDPMFSFFEKEYSKNDI